MQQFMSLIGTGAGAVVREIVDVPDGLTPGEGIFTEAFAATLVPFVAGVEVGWVQREDGTYTAAASPAVGSAVPASASSAQAKIQLHRTPGSAAGRTLLDDVTAAVQLAGGEVAIWFSDARTWERTNPYVGQLGANLKLKPADIDALFVSAAQIAV